MDKTKISQKQIFDMALNVYHYGSYVYGTFVDGKSDYDYIVVLPDCYIELDNKQFEENNNQYSFYTQTTWQKKLDNNDVDAIETYFLPKKMIIKETIPFSTQIKSEKIRENFSKVASNSFVKCKKKLIIEKDFNPNVAKKSLWHSLRIINFGVQILKYGKIIDYSAMNFRYDEIVKNERNDWEYYKKKYQQIYNNLKTQFRILEK